ncbi:MAG: ABC transporter permease [bacterium]|nr:ABC transporter permease [bacterium]MCP4966931.1 ABC transporter permease [bacterium]
MSGASQRSGIQAMVIAVAGATMIAALLLWALGANPLEAFKLLFEGSFGSMSKLSATLLVWVPLVIASASLVITYSTGLWNIGVEGQIIMGAIFATWAARTIPGPGWVVMLAGIILGIVGGMLWALLAGVLKTHGGVNEIFGGLGLYFVALGLTTYLVIGPWSREGVASTSGTDLFDADVWFPRIGSLDVSWLSLLLAIIAIGGVYFVMRGTMFGLKLKSVGNNMASSARLGIPSNRYMLGAFAVAGGLAGLAGTTQAMAFHHKLVPSVSGGFGFLGILVVLLAGFRAAPVAPLALFFAALSVGASQLELRLDLDSSVGGVIQGTLVLFVMLATGWQRRRAENRAAAEAGGSN